MAGGAQAVGRACAACGERIVIAPDGIACTACETAYHLSCVTDGRTCPGCSRDMLVEAAARDAEQRARTSAVVARGRMAVLGVALPWLCLEVLIAGGYGALLGVTPETIVRIVRVVIAAFLLWGTLLGSVFARKMLAVSFGLATLHGAWQALLSGGARPALSWMGVATLSAVTTWVFGFSSSVQAYIAWRQERR